MIRAVLGGAATAIAMAATGCDLGGTAGQGDGSAARQLGHPYRIATTCGMVSDIVSRVAASLE